MAALRQSMAGLHTWAGLLAGWLLYAIFITGGVSYFREELTQWLRPEIPARPGTLDPVAVAERALATLARHAEGADAWQLVLPGPRGNAVEVAWEKGAERQRALLDPASGALLHPRDTSGGEFFYYFHFSLHYLPATLGRWIVGLCALMALVTLVSGVIVHRRLFSDFFTFRPGKGQRSWLDAHNVGSVLGLPFYVMIVYTGLVTLMFTYLPWSAQAALGEQARPALARLMQAKFDTPPPTGEPASLVALTPLLEQGAARWGRDGVGRVLVTHPGDAAARVAIVRGDHDRLSVRPVYLLFDGGNGKLLAAHDDAAAAVAVWGSAYALHLGRFADPVLRWLYFLSSMLGAAMVATGLVLWTVKRPQTSAGGRRLVATLNAATIAGLPFAVAAFLLANRLLPTGLQDRASSEIDCFFLGWAVAALCAIRRRAWHPLWLAAALLWALLPLADIWLAGGRFLVHDLMFTGVAALCAYLGITYRNALR